MGKVSIKYIFNTLCFVLLLFVEANAETIFTIRSGESDDDRRMDYPQELFKLALEKTVLTYGPYKLVKAPIGPNMKRSLQNIKNKTYPNYFLRQSASSENLKGYRYAFPNRFGDCGISCGLYLCAGST